MSNDNIIDLSLKTNRAKYADPAKVLRGLADKIESGKVAADGLVVAYFKLNGDEMDVGWECARITDYMALVVLRIVESDFVGQWRPKK